MATKISITMGDVELAFLRRRAKQSHGGNLSAAFVEAARLLCKQETLRAFLRDEGVPPLAAAELAAIQDEWRAPAEAARRPRKRRAA